MANKNDGSSKSRGPGAFKLFLFVMMDGWSRLIHGLVLTYQ